MYSVDSVGRRRSKKPPRDFPFPYHAEIELEITTLTNRGVGLGRVPLKIQPPNSENPNDDDEMRSSDWVVMVPFSLPGERVRARVFRNQKNFSEADLVEVLVPSADRVAPRCPQFGQCGGCQYQHLAYEAQLIWKQQQVAELLEHLAGLAHPVNPVLGSPRQFGYRSKITPHFNLPKSSTLAGRSTEVCNHNGYKSSETDSDQKVEELPIGFLRQGTRFNIVDVPRCDIATEGINAHLAEVRTRVRADVAEGRYKKGATLLLREASGEITTEYDRVITETVGDLKLRFLARDFFQNNPFILPDFTRYVQERAAETGARFLVDTYCGSGLFALSAAPAFERVAGIEISDTSVEFATANAAANGVTNATFQAGHAAEIFAGLEFAAPETVVVIDPPRKGCDEQFLSQLFEYSPRAVVYVSCDPATQMRDLVSFNEAGYRLTDVQPFDLFPQTRHLECVVTLAKQS